MVVDQYFSFVFLLVLLCRRKRIKLQLHLLFLDLCCFHGIYLLLSGPLGDLELAELASHGTVHNVFRVFVTDAHDASHCVWVLLKEMFVHHDAYYFFFLQEILHHFVVHLVLLVINCRVVLHDDLSSAYTYSVEF